MTLHVNPLAYNGVGVSICCGVKKEWVQKFFGQKGWAKQESDSTWASGLSSRLDDRACQNEISQPWAFCKERTEYISSLVLATPECARVPCLCHLGFDALLAWPDCSCAVDLSGEILPQSWGRKAPDLFKRKSARRCGVDLKRQIQLVWSNRNETFYSPTCDVFRKWFFQQKRKVLFWSPGSVYPLRFISH